MTRKTIAILFLLVVLLVSMVGTVMADTIADEPTATPTAEETLETEEPTAAETEVTDEPADVTEVDATGEESEAAGAKFFTHPVVQLLSAYFDRDWQPEAAAAPDPDAAVDPLASPEPAVSDLGPIGEQIAAYHEEGMGFGVLVKIFAMAEASQLACEKADAAVVSADAAADVCTPVTAEELKTEFQSGTGMGQLFKDYGKPALLGVGHVRKAVKNLPKADEPVVVEPVVDEDVVVVEGDGGPTPLLNAKGGKPEKLNLNQGKPVKEKSNNGNGHKK